MKKLKPDKKPRALTLPWWHPASLIASVMGWGYMPMTPVGHVGSFGMSLMVPFALWPLLEHTDWIVLVVAVGIFLGTWAVMEAERVSGGSDHDASAIVMDEFVGSALAVAVGWPLMQALMPAPDAAHTAWELLYIGLVFRFFDLVKPWPAMRIDRRWHHPFSVIADDLIAGLYAGLVGPLPFLFLV